MSYPTYNQFQPYQPYNPYMQGYQPMQQPAQQPMQPQPQQQATPQMLTPPTRHAEIIQVSPGEVGEREVDRYSVGVGESQMFMAQDDSIIFIKTGTPSGGIVAAFPRRPPAPEAVPFNPAEYVRLDALPDLVSAQIQAAVAAAMPAKQPRARKDAEAAE